MRLSEDINEAINNQISHEFSNMLKYKQIASYFEDLRLTNLASKFYKQADEEYEHGSKMIEYLNKRIGGKYIPIEIDNPIINITNYIDTGKIFLEAELNTSESLEEIARLIYQSESYMDVDFIQEFLKYQIIEEDEADEYLKQISLVSDIILFDKILGD